MSVRLVWRGGAIRDVQEVYNWFEAGSKGAGERLAAELEGYVAFILEHPNGPARWRSRYRKMIQKRFPYQVVSRFEKDTVIIYSAFHSK